MEGGKEEVRGGRLKGKGYQYSHDHPGGISPDQDYLGVETTYYRPSDRGYEKHIRAYLEYVRKLRGEGGEEEMTNEQMTNDK